MADLFTHVLAGFILATALSWRYRWITPPMVAACMVGAALPDLNRVELVLPAATVEAALGVAWSWTPFHRAGGTLLVVLVLTVLVRRRLMPLVFAMLLLGAASHYALDFLLWKPSGQSGPLLWPFTDWRLTIDGVYRSSDRWPAVVATLLAGLVILVDRQIESQRSGAEQ